MGDFHADYPADLLAFTVVVYLALRWGADQFKVPGGLFRTVVQDATHYFLVIFTSHLVFELALLFGRVRALLYWFISLSHLSRSL